MICILILLFYSKHTWTLTLSFQIFYTKNNNIDYYLMGDTNCLEVGCAVIFIKLKF